MVPWIDCVRQYPARRVSRGSRRSFFTPRLTQIDRRFEMLAFSSDVAHWRKKQELVGVSVRYVCLSARVRLRCSHNSVS